MAREGEVRITALVLTDLKAWRLVLRLLLERSPAKLGLDAARFIANEVFRDPQAVVRHHHGRRGSDVESVLRGNYEVKLKFHLLTNRNGILTNNVRDYVNRGGARERGLAVVCPLALGGRPIKIYRGGEIVVLAVMAEHEPGQKHLVEAEAIIEAAKAALEREFPGQEYSEMDREELLAVVNLRGMRAVELHVTEMERELAEVRGEVRGEVSEVRGEVSEVRGEVSEVRGEVVKVREMLRRLLDHLGARNPPDSE